MVRTRHAFHHLLQWAAPIGLLLAAIWLVTQEANAPQLILLLLLYIITVNFSLPPAYGGVGLTPVVGVSSILVAGLETAVFLAAISYLLAELARPLWNPMWDSVNLPQPAWPRRLGPVAVHLLALLAGGLAYRARGGLDPLLPVPGNNLAGYTALALGYGLTHLLLAAVVARLRGQRWTTFLVDQAPAVLTTSLLAQPFAIFGAITFATGGLPVFIIFSLGIMVFSVVTWLSWQRRFVAQQQLRQFALLNQISLSLRETLDLPTVLARTSAEITSLIPADRLTIFLRDENGRWQRPFDSRAANGAGPDDFARWVAERQKLLDLHAGNLHHAARRQLAPPNPPPRAWLGVPLLNAPRQAAGQHTLGVLALQRYADGRPFSRWHQEMLLALAAQVSAAIENARLYSETLRLYNQTDEALARRLEQLQALLNTVREGVLMVDRGGALLLVNPLAAAVLHETARPGQPLPATAVARLGYAPADWQARLAALQAGDALPATAVTYQAVFPQAAPLPATAVTYQAAFPQAAPTATAETRRWFERTEAAVTGDAGQVMGWLIVLRDVTEERALAEQRTDVTRMIVHDLRNPITTLVSTLRAVEQQLPETAAAAPIHPLLADAQHGCVDLLDLVDSLMDINRLEAGGLQPDAEAMRLPPLVQGVVQRLRPLAAQRQVTLVADLPADLPAVWGDADMLRRVFVNLLDNALKFTPAGGRVTVTAVAAGPLPDHEPGVRCTVADTGPGIPPAQRDQIFDRYMRTNRGGAQVRGTGLGLTFCKLAVEAHAGQIWVEDAPGGGSCFVLTLPGIPLFSEYEA
ncbi:MAG: GAF domain-containing protein [Anaerolineales bacterium]|nr:GAF domain-containing protein [Anaerolineales bacterium]